MSKKISAVFFVIVLAFASQAQESNWNGYGDTAVIRTTVDSAEIVYTSKVFNLGKGRFNRVTVMGRDSTTAGFYLDSLEFDYGYRSGRLVLDSGTVTTGRKTNVDTAWDVRVKLGTFSSANFGVMREANIDSLGVLSIGTVNTDTLGVDGFAVMSVQYAPLWDVLLQYWLEGNDATSTQPIEVRFQHNQQKADIVKQQ